MTKTGPLVQHLVPLSPTEPPRVFGAPALYAENELLALGMNIDGTLWSVEEPGLLRQWSLSTRREQGQRQLDELATAWAFNWAGRLLASGSDEVAVWEVASGEALAEWPAPSWVTALAFQPGHAVLASGHDDGLVQVWDWADRKLLAAFKAHTGPVASLAFAHDGKLLASAGEELAIHLWQFATGTKVRSLIGHTGRIPTLVWHPDHKRLFSAGWDTTVRVWDTTTGEPIILLNSHANEVHACALSADGKLLASADADSAVHVWDTTTYQTVAMLRGGTAELKCLCWTPDDDRGNVKPPLLAYAGSDRVIHLWDSRLGSNAGTGPDSLWHRTNLALSPDGARLFSVSAGTDLRIWDVASGEAVSSVDQSGEVRAFALSPNGQWLAVSRPGAGENSVLTFVQANSGQRLGTCDGQSGPITALAFSPSSSLLASAGPRSSDVWLWTVPSGAPALLLNEALSGCSVEALAWHPDGHWLAVGGIDWLATSGQDGELVIWGPHERQAVRRFPWGVTALAYHPQGTVLAAARVKRTICLIRDEEITELEGHIDTVHCLAFSPDGQWLASGGEDRTVRVWDVITGQLVGAWALENVVRAVAFGPEGKFLYTGNGNSSCYQIELEQLLSGT